MSNTYVVRFAIWGASNPTSLNQSAVLDVTSTLQTILNTGTTIITPSNGVAAPDQIFTPDPAVGAAKAFGALIAVNGVDQYYACAENDTIDISILPLVAV
jgi:hypothetical protein